MLPKIGLPPSALGSSGTARSCQGWSRVQRGERCCGLVRDFPSKIKILIADRSPLFREGLKHVLSAQENFELLGEAGDSDETIRLIDLLKPDVLLLEMAIAPLNGIEVLERSN